MSEVDDIQRRSALGIAMLVVPIVGISLVAFGYAMLLWFGSAGRPADGPWSRLDFEGCAEAADVVTARLAWMGLVPDAPEPRSGGFSVAVQLPSDARSRERIPGTLAREGRLVVRHGEDGEVIVTEADVAEATPVLGFLDHPKVLAQLSEDGAVRLLHAMMDEPEGFITVHLDGTRVRRFPNLPPVEAGRLYLDSVEGTGYETLDFAAETAVLLEHGPLPCALTVSTTTLEGR